MHCPRCGHEIDNQELRFCPQCGFQLAGVAQLLKADGDLPTLSEAVAARVRLTRRDGIKLSVLCFFVFTLFLTPILAILGGEEIVALTAVLGTMGSMVMAALSLMFLPKSGRPISLGNLKLRADAKGIHTTTPPAALPAAHDMSPITYTPPTRGEWKDVEYSTPGSVTEGTTKLLKEDEPGGGVDSRR